MLSKVICTKGVNFYIVPIMILVRDPASHGAEDGCVGILGLFQGKQGETSATPEHILEPRDTCPEPTSAFTQYAFT